MKKKFGILIVVAFGLILMLTACGEKSQQQVVDKLTNNLEAMDGYKAKAEMKMNTGDKPQTFTIDTWYKKKDFYRVALADNEDKKSNQIILKNEDGVFVLTPALEKSFKFQTEWPENSSQPYLYQSLVNDVTSDKDAAFEVTDKHYIFKTKTNYQSNNNLPFQEVYFNKKTYTPELVKVLDKDKKALVEVKFSSFDTKPGFEKDDFTMDKNMASSDVDAPVSGEETDDTLTVLFPEYTAGAELKERKEVEIADGKRVILTFSGEKNFTMVEEKRDVQPTLSSPQELKGDIVNLGHSVAALSDNTIRWNQDGVDFTLASEELTKEELVDVAKSVQGKEVK